MLFIVTTFLVIGLSMQLKPQTIDPNIPERDFHNNGELILKLDSRNGDKRLSSSSSDLSTSSSKSDNSAELKQSIGKTAEDDVLLGFIVVDDRQYAHGRRGKLLDPYRSLSLPPEQLAEANALRKLRNTNLVKNQPVIRKGEAKELYQNVARPPLPLPRHRKPRLAGRGEPTNVLQNIPSLEELLSLKNEGLANPSFPNVKVLSLNRKERAKDKKLNRGILPNNKDVNKENTYVVSRDQLIALRARWSKVCDKAAAKECKKACKNALKSACSDNTCGHKLKKSFKRACKRHCNGRFISGGSGGGGRSGSGSSD